MKKWHILHQKTQQLTEDDIFHILLTNRGVTKKKDIEIFLHPSLSDITIETVGLKKREVEKAKKRILSAIEKKESIVVYADYDVDGISAGAILWEILYKLGANVMPYIPHRVEEGYGLSKKGIDYIKTQYHPHLLLTVDCGVSAVSEIDYAKNQGMETIVFDHHILPQKLPHFFALVHTTKMTAAGITWFFSSLLSSNKKQYLDFAVLGTIADLIPLLGINRIITKYGLIELSKTNRIGLRALMKESGLEGEHIDVYDVSHVLSPRINAMGRLKHGLDALRLLCTRDKERAEKLAVDLHLTNRERQILTQEGISHARQYIIKHSLRDEKLLFIASELYPEGIIGLIAGKLVEEFYRPAVVISVKGEYSKASARSIHGFNIVEAFHKTSSLLESVGGHPMAAGFTIATKNLDSLKKELLLQAKREITEDMLTKVLKIDAILPFSFITLSFYQKIQQLAPFGVGNPEPVFVSYKVQVLQSRLVGKEGKHLKLTLLQKQEDKKRIYETYEAIGFGMGSLYNKMKRDVYIDIVYSIDENTWGNRKFLQLKLKDAKFAST